MKKMLAVMLLAVALVAPAFAADKGKSEIDVKIGANISPNFTVSVNDLVTQMSDGNMELDSVNKGVGADGKTGIVIGVDYFYYVMKDLGVGLGINKSFPITVIGDDYVKFDSTNIYLTAKQNIKVEDCFLDNVYFLGRIGYGINNAESDMSDGLDADNGLYWALGAGVEKSNILLEVVYFTSYFKFGDDEVSLDITESGFGVQVGYKFEL